MEVRGGSRVRMAKVRAAKGWGGKQKDGEGLGGLQACGQKPGGVARQQESQECLTELSSLSFLITIVLNSISDS